MTDTAAACPPCARGRHRDPCVCPCHKPTTTAALQPEQTAALANLLDASEALVATLVANVPASESDDRVREWLGPELPDATKDLIVARWREAAGHG